MRVIKPDRVNIAAMRYLNSHPEGTQTQILSEAINVEYQTLNGRLRRLEVLNLVSHSNKLWHITDKGKEWLLNVLNEGIGIHRTPIRKEPIRIKDRIPPKRANGVRIYFKPFRTERARLPAKLRQAGIPFTEVRVKGYTQYHLSWQGYQVNFTTRHAIAYAPDAEYAFERDGWFIENEELQKAIRSFTQLIERAHIRVLEHQRGADRAIWAKVVYIEIAHTDSPVAKAAGQRKSYVPMAYDLGTGRLVDWVDWSILRELEFNEKGIEFRNSQMQQDMQDGKWSHRDEQARLKEVIEAVGSLATSSMRTNEAVQSIINLKQYENTLTQFKKGDLNLKKNMRIGG